MRKVLLLLYLVITVSLLTGWTWNQRDEDGWWHERYCWSDAAGNVYCE